jgi:hypothetical protein
MRILFAAVALLFVSGCGSDQVPTTPEDGKIRPPPSGERTAESVACDALSNAFSKALLSVGCAGTLRTCPTLLRTQSGAECLEYDKGSLDGCIEHLQAQTTCSDLAAAIDVCVVFSYGESAPAGCP